MAVQNIYLIAYNALSFLLWGHLTISTLLQLPALYAEPGLIADLYADVLPLLSATQTLAVLEIVHAALGLVRASAATTALQIGGKNLVVWTVMVKFPEIITGNEAGAVGFLGCVLAWGASEIIRYGFFVAQLSTGDTPRWLKLLRYNAFLPLYPIGLLSEAGLVYLALTEGTGVGQFYKGYLLLGLLTYLPAGPFLYTHMLSQRRKILKQMSTKKD
ncbi:phosphatase-like protein [Pestalotiopsis sp. NC0098]|nr:phosphatase-like protein [Pestalotiopsis sp. NC0098]